MNVKIIDIARDTLHTERQCRRTTELYQDCYLLKIINTAILTFQACYRLKIDVLNFIKSSISEDGIHGIPF